MNETVYIYRLFNFANCKSYIGHSSQPKLRLRSHMNLLKSGKHPNKEMQLDFDKYGDVFSFSLIDTKTKFREQSEEYKWMRKLMTYDERYGYNTHDWAMQGDRERAGLSCRYQKTKQ